MKACATHAHRFEKIFLGKLSQRFAADSPDNLGKQKISRVAVQILVTWSEIEFLLARNDLVDLVSRCVLESRSGQLHQVGVLANAAGVMDELANSNWSGVLRHLRQVFADIVIEREFALSRQQSNAD